ncbi:MAG: restriction endonuclease subunit S [Verrucomicrobia bacterium]|nr:restriction endonuclease subunit S [Verrucomicrobiota bacterium]
MTAQELKNSVLQLAIQGKLVEQRPEEGTAEELYQQIQSEKAKLLKAGKIKKEKPLPEISEDEIPFEIPETWKWVRVGEITILNPKNDIDDNLDTAFIPMSCISDGFRNQHTFEIKKWKDIKKGFTHFADNDIGIAKITPCFQNRKSVIFRQLKNGYGAGTTELSIVRVINATLIHEYLLWFFKSNDFISNGMESFTGTAGQQRIHKDYLVKCLIPLPPLEEQKRIVAKIEEIFPHIERFGELRSQLKNISEDLRKSILQQAIQGKLVEQYPNDEPASKLLERIRAKKERLIKAGKIKKEKPLPPITEEEMPFEIPKNWAWSSINELFFVTKLAGFEYTKYFTKGNIRADYPVHIVRAKNVKMGHFIENEDEAISADLSDLLYRSALTKNCLLMTFIGAGIGDTCEYHSTKRHHLAPNVAKIEPQTDGILLQYYLIWLMSPEGQKSIEKIKKSTAQPSLSMETIRSIRVAVPPLAEQQRIVAKIAELLPVCDKLKSIKEK